MSIRKCRVCGCTDKDCRNCIAIYGGPCSWYDDDLCTACLGVERNALKLSDAQRDMFKAIGLNSTFEKPFHGNYKRMQGGRGISFFNRTAESLRRLRLINYRGFVEAHGRGGWYMTEFGRKLLRRIDTPAVAES